MMSKEFVESLRGVADFYEAHPKCPLPNCATGSMDIFSQNTKEELTKIMKEFDTCGTRKDGGLFRIEKRFGAMKLSAVFCIENVCKKKVVGTKKIKKQVPIEYEEREVEQEIIEWECNGSLVPTG